MWHRLPRLAPPSSVAHRGLRECRVTARNYCRAGAHCERLACDLHPASLQPWLGTLLLIGRSHYQRLGICELSIPPNYNRKWSERRCMLSDRHNIIYSNFVNECLSLLTNSLSVSLTALTRIRAPNRIDFRRNEYLVLYALHCLLPFRIRMATSSISIGVHSILLVHWSNKLTVEPTVRKGIVFINSIRAKTRFRLLQHLKFVKFVYLTWQPGAPRFLAEALPYLPATIRLSRHNLSSIE